MDTETDRREDLDDRADDGRASGFRFGVLIGVLLAVTAAVALLFATGAVAYFLLSRSPTPPPSAPTPAVELAPVVEPAAPGLKPANGPQEEG
jgi:hypothetical protein